MKRASVVLGCAALAAGASGLSAQGIRLDRVSTRVLYESYSFDPGLVFNKVTELTVPVGIDIGLGRFGTLALSSGFAQVDLRSADAGTLANQSVSGIMDSEARLGVNLVPGHLIAFASGAVPTGVKTVRQGELAILGAISSDVIGFAAPSLGSGGSVGGGLAGALSLGRFALGLGANYKLPLSYQPVVGQPNDLKPGSEFRVRAGLEGPLARRTYVRVAGIYAVRAKDEVGTQTQNGVGNRIIGYLALTQAVGSTQWSLYGFDVYRGSPQLEATAAGQAILPKGNLIAMGTRWAVPFGRNTELTPRVEYRVSSAAPDANTSGLERQGSSWRFGFDFRQVLTPAFAVILQGSGMRGSVVQGGSDVNFHGLRMALHVDITP